MPRDLAQSPRHLLNPQILEFCEHSINTRDLAVSQTSIGSPERKFRGYMHLACMHAVQLTYWPKSRSEGINLRELALFVHHSVSLALSSVGPNILTQFVSRYQVSWFWGDKGVVKLKSSPRMQI